MVSQSTQLTLDFTPGLTVRYRSLRACIRGSVYSSPKGDAAIASDLDMSPSEFSKRINEDGAEARPLRVDDFEKILVATGDFTPIYYLVEKYLRSAEARQSQALSQIAMLLPTLEKLVTEAKG